MEMKNLRYYIAIALGLLAFFFYWFAEDSDVTYHAPVMDKKMIEEGRKLATLGTSSMGACTTCHGVDGKGDLSLQYPRLAGLNAAYIEKQLTDFSQNTLKHSSHLKADVPAKRYDKTMTTIAQSLSKEDRKNVSAYYSQLSFSSQSQSIDASMKNRGEALALRGKPESMLPACMKCHGLQGEGFRGTFPPLAGQPFGYLVKQLQNFQKGIRHNDPLGMMASIAKKLSDSEIQSVAYFYSKLAVTMNGEK